MQSLSVHCSVSVYRMSIQLCSEAKKKRTVGAKCNHELFPSDTRDTSGPNYSYSQIDRARQNDGSKGKGRDDEAGEHNE